MPKCGNCGSIYAVNDCEHCPETKTIFCSGCGLLIVVENEYHMRLKA